MDYEFNTIINKSQVTLNIRPDETESAVRIKPGTIHGYPCALVKVNGMTLTHPEYVKCYAQTFRKEGPSLCFKLGAADALRTFTGNGGLGSMTVRIPKEKQEEFLKMIDRLDGQLVRGEEEADQERDENDKQIGIEDIIEMSYSPRFVSVRYPKPSNRAKEESRIWSQFSGNMDLNDWIETNLEPYCTGLGCGSAKKYKIPYAKYEKLLGEYQKQAQTADCDTL